MTESKCRALFGARSVDKCIGAIVFAIHLATLPELLLAQETKLKFVKVTDDKNQPVYSEIVQFPPNVPDQPVPLAETSDKGELKIEYECNQGVRIQARPYSEAYTYSKKAFCRPTLELRVEPIRVASRLQTNLNSAVEARDYATAMLIANELANIETREDNGVSGTEAESLAVVYAEKAFEVAEGVVFDSEQGKVVMSSELKDKVIQYQARAGLERTGKLDYSTASTLANTSSGEVRYNVFDASDM